MTEPHKPRILLADDHQIVLEGLHRLLAAEFDICGEALDGMALLDLARTRAPDLIVADISMPLLNGVDALRRLREEGIAAKVVFLTMHPDATYLSRALEVGASGYVLKHTASEELGEAIREALRGRVFVSAQLRSPAIDALRDPARRHLKHTIDLTQRQREVLQLLAEGKSAKEIGAILDISPRTVETHKYKMMDELGLKTSAQLVQHALRHGLIAGTGDP
ncbi:MAG: response regulator transcription factor [Bryobacteraceae bacterium]